MMRSLKVVWYDSGLLLTELLTINSVNFRVFYEYQQVFSRFNEYRVIDAKMTFMPFVSVKSNKNNYLVNYTFKAFMSRKILPITV